jgi:hypothetical protein
VCDTHSQPWRVNSLALAVRVRLASLVGVEVRLARLKYVLASLGEVELTMLANLNRG